MMISVYSQDAILTVRIFKSYFLHEAYVYLPMASIPDINDTSQDVELHLVHFRLDVFSNTGPIFLFSGPLNASAIRIHST